MADRYVAIGTSVPGIIGAGQRFGSGKAAQESGCVMAGRGRGAKKGQATSSGNATTSRRVGAPVSSITTRSNPRALPAQGGIPSRSIRT